MPVSLGTCLQRPHVCTQHHGPLSTTHPRTATHAMGNSSVLTHLHSSALLPSPQNANSYFSNALFIKDHSPKPLCRLEALSSSVAATVTDANVSLVITLSSYGAAARMVSKYRPAVPQVCTMLRYCCVAGFRTCCEVSLPLGIAGCEPVLNMLLLELHPCTTAMPVDWLNCCPPR